MSLDMSSIEPQAEPARPAPPGGQGQRPRRRLISLTTARWLAGRVVTSLVAVYVVMSAVFLVTRLVSNPARRMLPLGSSQQQIDALNTKLGLGDPLAEQYVRFLGDLLRLDLGNSIWVHRPALQVALERLPATFTLVGTALLISLVVFVPLGILASRWPGSFTDRCVTGFSLAGLSMPQFWLGAIVVLVVGVKLGWLPTSGSGSPAHAVLPAVTFAFTMGGRLAQVTRTSFLDQAKMPYVAMARAKGFSTTYVLRRHVLRNALPSMLTIVSWDFARAVTSAAVVVEVVFAWPGFGSLVIESVQRQDFTVIQASVLVGAAVIVVINTISDILSSVIDPRVVKK